MKAVLLFLAAINGFGQVHLLSPTAEFDLNAGHRPHHPDRTLRSYFAARPNGLTLIRIAENSVVFTSADLNGRILQNITDLASVHAQIYTALLRQDGSVWLVSSGPNLYNQLDLYSPAGKYLTSVRLLPPAGEIESPIAAADDELVLQSASDARFASSQSQLIHLGNVVKGQFKERAEVRLAPPIGRAIPILASNGDLLLINETSGTTEVIDPNAKSGSLVQLEEPRRVQAAAVDSNYLYLLAADGVLKTDLGGRVLSTYRFKFNHRFAPAYIGVTGNSLYLLDKSGLAERFQIN